MNLMVSTSHGILENMPKRSRSKKLPKDVNQLAHYLVGLSTEDGDIPKRELSKLMGIIGRKGGKKGGPARAAKMTPEQRSESASKAARAKWAQIRAKDATP